MTLVGRTNWNGVFLKCYTGDLIVMGSFFKCYNELADYNDVTVKLCRVGTKLQWYLVEIYKQECLIPDKMHIEMLH